MNEVTLIYIGPKVEGDFDGKHFMFWQAVFADANGRPFIEKFKDENVLKALNGGVGSPYEIYYDKYGKLAMVSRVNRERR